METEKNGIVTIIIHHPDPKKIGRTNKQFFVKVSPVGLIALSSYLNDRCENDRIIRHHSHHDFYVLSNLNSSGYDNNIGHIKDTKRDIIHASILEWLTLENSEFAFLGGSLKLPDEIIQEAIKKADVWLALCVRVVVASTEKKFTL